jgi:DNA-directed RNA polymerase subunit RPC12/RpoP
MDAIAQERQQLDPMIAKHVNYKAASSLYATALAKAGVGERLQANFAIQRSCLDSQKDMAAALSNVFLKIKDVHVLNHLQLAHNDAIAYIDHLLISRDAISIIDSQTAAVSIFLEEDGSWARVINDQRFPVQSPFALCDEKLNVLIDYLATQMGRALGEHDAEREAAFHADFRRQRYASLGPGAEIAGIRPKSHTEIIRPASHLTDPILTFHHFEKPKRPKFSFRRKNRPKPPKHILSSEELKSLVDFLVDHDSAVSPVLAAARTISQRCRPLPPALEDVIRRIQEDTERGAPCDTMATDSLAVFHLCRTCASNRLQLELTEATRKFVCLDCDAITPVDVKCPGCGAEGELVQRRRTFFIRCPKCRHERVFFVNPT